MHMVDDHGVQTGSHALQVPMHVRLRAKCVAGCCWAAPVNPPNSSWFCPQPQPSFCISKTYNDQQGDDATVLLAADNFFEVLSARVPEPDVRDGPAKAFGVCVVLQKQSLISANSVR